MPAKMPVSYISKPPVPLSELPVGQVGYISFTEVSVAEDLTTYISPDAQVREKSFCTVEIRRNEDGYRVVLHHATLTFTPRQIANRADLIPVVEVVEEIEPDQTKEILDRLLERQNEWRKRGEMLEGPPFQE